MRVVLLCPAAPARPRPIRALGVGFSASELLAARNSSNETLRRRFICIATHRLVRQDSRIRVALLTACSALRAIPSLRSALTAFGGYVLITSRFVCDSCSFHHDSSAKLVLAYQTLARSLARSRKIAEAVLANPRMLKLMQLQGVNYKGAFALEAAVEDPPGSQRPPSSRPTAAFPLSSTQAGTRRSARRRTAASTSRSTARGGKT